MRYAILTDVAVAYKVVLSVVILLGCFYHRQWLDFGLVLVCTGVMLVSEMFNTTIEAFLQSGVFLNYETILMYA
jgi:diacylglycerol kinase (ATP)